MRSLRSGRRISTHVAPLIAGHLEPERREAILATLNAPHWLGHPQLHWPMPPSTSPFDSGFQPRRYWRGPTWPVMNWLFWWALQRIGATEEAANLRAASLAQLADGQFGGYYEPFTGEPLGSLDQSWTAAVVQDWLRVP